MFAFRYNQSENLHLSQEQWNYLIQHSQHSDLQQQNQNGWIPLMFAFKYNQSENLHLTTEQIDYLIQHSDLKQQSKNDWTPLMFALIYNQSENLHLSKKQFQTMYDALTEEQKQNTFKNLISGNYKNQPYLEKIHLLLYDLQFQPNEKTLKWLQENQNKDILKLIEKRNLWIQLQKKMNHVEKKEKMNRIKI
jgi:ankyrin repeat protein